MRFSLRSWTICLVKRGPNTPVSPQSIMIFHQPLKMDRRFSFSKVRIALPASRLQQVGFPLYKHCFEQFDVNCLCGFNSDDPRDVHLLVGEFHHARKVLV